MCWSPSQWNWGETMKKRITLVLAFWILLTLTGCAQKEEVTYYDKRSYIRSQTGDITRMESTYDENWNLLLQEITLNGNFASKTEYAYSEDNTVMTTTSTDATYGTKTSKAIRTFDEKGQMIKLESYDGDRLVSSSDYTYNEDGEMIFVKTDHLDSNIISTLERIFDDSGNLITYITDTGYYVGRYEYSYNKNNQRIREEYYRDDELLDYTEYVWEGNVGTGSSYNADGTLVGKIILEYDDFGNLLRLESQHPKGITLSVSCYEYIGTDGSISSGIPE